MTIASEITKLNTNLTNSYTACQNKGATMPTDQNFDNLAACISSISTGGGGSTLITKTITQNGTYNASTDNADGYSSVTVNVLGINREVNNGVYQAPSTSFTFSLPSTATDMGARSAYYAFSQTSGIIGADLSNLTNISGDNAFDHAFFFCPNFSTVDLSNLTAIRGTQAFSYAFHNSGLTNISFPKLKEIGKASLDAWLTSYGHFANCFNGCPNITTLTFPELTAIYNTGGTSAPLAVFYNNTLIQKMYFPKLSTITYGSGASYSNQNACKNLFNNCSALTELHFAAANQSAIEATAGYSTAWGRGAGNVTIYFDL